MHVSRTCKTSSIDQYRYYASHEINASFSTVSSLFCPFRQILYEAIRRTTTHPPFLYVLLDASHFGAVATPSKQIPYSLEHGAMQCKAPPLGLSRSSPLASAPTTTLSTYSCSFRQSIQSASQCRIPHNTLPAAQVLPAMMFMLIFHLGCKS